jgi:glycosyltransferase involved in cell wall biosynthesis
MTRLSVAIASCGEGELLRPCLESVAGVADELVVVDSSPDAATAAIAEAAGARVIRESNKLMLNVNKNVAIDASTAEWVLVLDPDERVSPELAEEIRDVVANGDHDAYWIPRRNHELGGVVKTMGMYPSLQLRLFRNGRARFPCEHIHEMVAVDGTTGRLRSDLVHEPPQSLFAYVHKRNLYSEHRARKLHEEGRPFRVHRLVLRPLWAFGKAYLAKGGWREGVRGFVMAASAGYGTFLQDAKLWQLEREEPATAPTHEVLVETVER